MRMFVKFRPWMINWDIVDPSHSFHHSVEILGFFWHSDFTWNQFLRMLIGNNHFIDPQLRTKMSAKTTTDGNSRDGFSTEYNFFKKHQQKSYSPNVGLEPTTLRLRVSCSTDWASRAVEKTERIIRKLKWELRRNLFGWNPICSRFGSRVSFSSNEKERVLAST